jgi:hypothetical protein
MVQLSPIERRTQTFNIHGRSRSASPQTQDASAVFQGPMLLHEVMETSVYVADGVESSDQILVNVGLPENGDLTSDGESRREPVSAVVQAFANPFVYQTPIRSRTNVSSGTIIQATPIDVHSFLPRGTIPSRQPPITQNSVSPTARMTHLGRSATSMLSGSPSLPSPSGYTLSLPHQSRRSSVSVRGGTDSRREERSVAYRRTSDNAENEPIAQDLYDASTGISSPSSRPHPGQLDEALEQWQRYAMRCRPVRATADLFLIDRNPESPLQSRQVTSPTNASSRTGSRWNYPYYPRYSPRTSTNDSVAHIDHSPIRAELPGPTNSRTASWQSLHSTNAVNGLSSRSQAVLADIGNDPFTTSYRSNLMRNASIESSLMAAQDEDEDDRDFMMSSSPPAQCADGEENEGAARLVADIVQCQLESGVSVDEAVEAVEASAAFFDGYGDRLAAQSSGRGLDSMFRPYSMTQITHAELTGAAIQG